MKRKAIICALFAFCFMIFSLSVAYATDGEQSVQEKLISSDGEYEYCFLDDGSVEITRYMGTDYAITIPERIDGCSVSSIGESAFCRCAELKEVTVPGHIRRIGSDAFANHYGSHLTKVNLSYGLEEIGPNAFYQQSEIEAISIPESVSIIGLGAFDSCYGLKDVAIPDGLAFIAPFAFCKCGLTSLIIPDSVVSIGSYAFCECGLTMLTIPNSVVYIGEMAFAGCSNLTDVTISEATSIIRGGAFDATPWFEEKCEEIESVSINGNLLRYCGNGSNVQIPNGVTAICDGVFSYNSNLESVVVPEGVTFIGESAFENCVNLKSITIPDSVIYIGESAFCGCENLKSIEIPEGVTSIGWETFALCFELENITIPESVSNIGYCAFAQCGNLKKIEIPGSLVHLGLYALLFNDTDGDSLLSVKINSTRSSCRLGGWNFQSGKVVNLTLPVGSIEDLHRFDSLARLTLLPDGSSSIPAGAFSDCDNLVEVSIPEEIVSFGKGAFEGTPWLSALRARSDFVIVNDVLVEYNGHESNVVIPDGVTAISGNAFSECSNLVNISIPESVVSFDEGVFEGTIWLDTKREQSDFVIVNDILLDYCGDDCEVTVPDGVTKIAPGTFSGNSNLTKVRLPDSIKEIGARAFMDCENLKDITIPSNVVDIGDRAFCNCISLTEIIVPDCVAKIGSGAFCGCSKLASIVLPEGITEIESETFSGCSCLRDVMIPDRVESIEWRAFEGCESINTVLIPHTVSYIGEESFCNCGNLRDLTIPEGVTAIGDAAFVGCRNLMNLRIPKSVMFLGQNSYITDCERTLVYVIHGSFAEYFAAFAGPSIVVVE